MPTTISGADDHLRVLAAVGIPSFPTREESNLFVRQVAQRIVAMLQLRQDFIRQVDTIMADTTRTPEFRNERAQDAGRKALTTLKGFTREIPLVEKRLNELAFQIEQKSRVPDTPEAATRETELRSELRRKDPVEIEGFLKVAIEDTDTLVYGAIINWPKTSQPLTPKTIEDGKREWAFATDPSLEIEFDEASTAAEKGREISSFVENSIRTTGGLPQVEPLARMAGFSADTNLGEMRIEDPSSAVR